MNPTIQKENRNFMFRKNWKPLQINNSCSHIYLSIFYAELTNKSYYEIQFKHMVRFTKKETLNNLFICLFFLFIAK